MEWEKENYLISTDKQKLNPAYIHDYLSNQSYWARNIPYRTVLKSIEGSICFGVYAHGKQIGFARVITDNATFAYLADVFIDENFRKRGLGHWMIEIILSHPDLQGLRRFMLATRDAHELYANLGFVPLTHTDRWMHIHYPDLYTRIN